MRMRRYFWCIYALAMLLVVSSCSKPQDITGRFDGVWKTEWNDILDDTDIDDIRVSEAIFFERGEISRSAGTFTQAFEGEVDFDDWEYEQTIAFSLVVRGTWKVKDRDEIVLYYDMESIELETGKSNVDADFTDAAIDLLTGNWGSALVNGLMQGSAVDNANKKIDKAVQRGILAFFKDMFRTMNVDKEGMTDVVIDGGTMTCSINHGFFGRDAVYDRVKGYSSAQSLRSLPDYSGEEVAVVDEVAEPVEEYSEGEMCDEGEKPIPVENTLLDLLSDSDVTDILRGAGRMNELKIGKDYRSERYSRGWPADAINLIARGAIGEYNISVECFLTTDGQLHGRYHNENGVSLDLNGYIDGAGNLVILLGHGSEQSEWNLHPVGSECGGRYEGTWGKASKPSYITFWRN